MRRGLDWLSGRVPAGERCLEELVLKVKQAMVQRWANAGRKAADAGPLKGIVDYCVDPIVTNDVIGTPHSSVLDSLSTNVMQGDMVKILSWYDNEWGFSNRMVDALLKMA